MTTLGQRLTREHQELDALYEDLANRVHCGDTATIDEAWGPLETRLRAHMDFEERHLLPRFRELAPVTAQQIVGEHAMIRGALADMGVAIEVHALREESLTAFLELLRAHGRREDETLYRCIELAGEDASGSEVRVQP